MRGVKAPRFAFALLGSLVLGAPFVLVARAAGALVGPLSGTAVTALLLATAPLSTVVATEPEPEADARALETPTELTFDAVTKSPARGMKAQPKAKPAALFVSEAAVLRLVQSAARPRGSFVAKSAQHPAGLQLSGVGALGIGLQDGDVLVEALGFAPRSPGEIIGAIIEARAKHARFLSGTIWRHGQTFAITVEQPYLPARTPS
jgi:hypothetical protein